jgi:hypothetical protein
LDFLAVMGWGLNDEEQSFSLAEWEEHPFCSLWANGRGWFGKNSKVQLLEARSGLFSLLPGFFLMLVQFLLFTLLPYPFPLPLPILLELDFLALPAFSLLLLVDLLLFFSPQQTFFLLLFFQFLLFFLPLFARFFPLAFYQLLLSPGLVQFILLTGGLFCIHACILSIIRGRFFLATGAA